MGLSRRNPIAIVRFVSPPLSARLVPRAPVAEGTQVHEHGAEEQGTVNPRVVVSTAFVLVVASSTCGASQATWKAACGTFAGGIPARTASKNRRRRDNSLMC